MSQFLAIIFERDFKNSSCHTTHICSFHFHFTFLAVLCVRVCFSNSSYRLTIKRHISKCQPMYYIVFLLSLSMTTFMSDVCNTLYYNLAIWRKLPKIWHFAPRRKRKAWNLTKLRKGFKMVNHYFCFLTRLSSFIPVKYFSFKARTCFFLIFQWKSFYSYARTFSLHDLLLK